MKHAAQHTTHRSAPSNWGEDLIDSASDPRRVEFLLALDAAEFSVTEWEAQFLESFMKRPDALTARFSDAQRRAIDGMRRMYEHRLPCQSVSQRISESVSERIIPPCAAGACGYFVRGGESGRQQRCGQPATKKTNQGLELCEAHYNQRVEYLEKMRVMKQRRVR